MQIKFYKFSLFQVFILAFFSILIVFSKISFKIPLKLPGHSAVFWIALLIIARGIVPRKGAASLVGLLSGILASFLTLGVRGPLDTFLSYTATGLGIEIGALVFKDMENLALASITGAMGNLAKLCLKIVLDFLLGMPPALIIAGRSYAFFTYIPFGLLGGFLGSLVLRALQKAGLFVFLNEKK